MHMVGITGAKYFCHLYTRIKGVRGQFKKKKKNRTEMLFNRARHRIQFTRCAAGF